MCDHYSFSILWIRWGEWRQCRLFDKSFIHIVIWMRTWGQRGNQSRKTKLCTRWTTSSKKMRSAQRSRSFKCEIADICGIAIGRSLVICVANTPLDIRRIFRSSHPSCLEYLQGFHVNRLIWKLKLFSALSHRDPSPSLPLRTPTFIRNKKKLYDGITSDTHLKNIKALQIHSPQKSIRAQLTLLCIELVRLVLSD